MTETEILVEIDKLLEAGCVDAVFETIKYLPLCVSLEIEKSFYDRLAIDGNVKGACAAAAIKAQEFLTLQV